MKGITLETRIYTVYKFNELPLESQEKALDNYREINVDYDWWTCLYDDAERIGLEITDFEDCRCGMRYLSGHNARTVISRILTEHVRRCDTYQTAAYFLRIQHCDGKTRTFDFDSWNDNFLHDISEDYRRLLTREYEYLIGDDAVRETLEANEYWFTLQGKID